MKKINPFVFFNILGLGIGYAAIVRLLNHNISESFTQINLPAGFPSISGAAVIWAILFILWAVGCLYVYSVPLSPRRLRNIFLNSLILIIGLFTWNFMLYNAVNLSGTLAVSIATLLLSVVVWFMYLVTHRNGGYLFTPVIVWQLYQLYLSIALMIKN